MNAAADPWVITQRDKLKYQEQFKALQPQGGFVTGAQAKGFFLQSGLPPLVLGQIWALADTDSDGKMNINEFSLACKLINLKLRGMDIPKVLPPTMIASLAVVGGTPTMTPTGSGSLSPLDPLKTMSGSMKPAVAPISAPIAVPGAPIITPVSAAALPGAVPAIPGIVPGTLPGVLPQTVQAITGALPAVGSAAAPVTTAGVVPPSSGIMPGMIPVAGTGQAVMPVMANTTTGGPVSGAVLGGIPPPGIVGGVVPGMVPTAMVVAGPSPIASVPAIVPGVGATVPGIVPAGAKVASPPNADAKVPATPTPPQSNPPSRHMSISERAPSIESPQGEWAVKGPAKRKYTQVFNAADRSRSGYLTGVQARGILLQSKLPQATLAQIWTVSDLDSDGRLSCDEFILAMFLCDKAMNGEKIPVTLPPDWIPPSFRKIKSRQGSVSGPGSRTGSTPSSRHASVSSQGAVDADPAAGLPQTTFEDKRKENFDKGQAELDRRRKLLQDQQRKEKEERERKEREEAEKKEKARLEAERKQQEELERQLQKQRELEMEKEEQRKRELEAKEAARKELEKQRQLEWEQARIAEMNAQKQREQERVLKQKAHNTQLNVELSTLNEKIKDLSQKICDTRAGVTNVKTVIDGMRSQRDTSMSEMTQLKARIKEQNAKLLQLTQERAKWDAKTRSAGLPTDAGQQEQLNAAFANKQLVIKQLKDKVENIRKDMESKKEDINSHDNQMSEVKEELSTLINKCEELYADYDTQRTQVLELKYNKKNDNVSATSAWNTGSSAWGTSVDKYGGLSNDTGAVAAAATTASVDMSGPAPEGFVKYRAVYEFSARNADEISFVPGDTILVPLEQNAEPGWLAGEINGHTGWFPETYVEKVEDDVGAATETGTGTVAAPAATTETPITAVNDTKAITDYTAQDTYNDNNQPTATTVAAEEVHNGDVEYYIAAYPYNSAEAGDLSFNAGEMIMVIKKEGEWWTGTIGNHTGMFPSNYVQKADVGTAAAAASAPAPVTTTDDKKDNNVNGNTPATHVTSTAAAQPEKEHDDAFKQTDVHVTSPSVATSNSTVNAEETHTNEDLDTEVSQINTQSKSQTETSESYSRPMSRTSSMTPGMRAKRSEIAQVIAPYEATSSEQLSLTRGQLIMIRKKTDSGWWEGELQAKGRRRQIGWFPATYVKVLQGGRNSGRNTPVSGSRIEMTEQILDKVIALYAYKAQNDDELSFEKDDIISVLGRDEPEWWRGELNGLSGLFPSNYVGPFVTSGKKKTNGK